MSLAKRTLDAMADIKAHLSYPAAQMFAQGVYRSSLRQYEGSGRVTGEQVSRDIRATLEHAEAFFLTKDMQAVVEWAAQSLDETDTLSGDLWPSHAGFLLLEDLHLFQDVRGRRMGLKAVTWRRAGRVTQVTFFTDADDDRDTTLEVDHIPARSLQSLRDQVGRYQVTHFLPVPEGMQVGPAAIRVDPDGNYVEGPPLVDGSDNPMRFVMSFLLMLNQTISRPEREHLAPKQAARFAKRRLPSMVTVVHMRRIEGSAREEGESHVEWQHRWVVRGHWRNQPVGPDYPGARQVDGRWVARIWISPFVKGPQDRPLVVSQKVYALSR